MSDYEIGLRTATPELPPYPLEEAPAEAQASSPPEAARVSTPGARSNLSHRAESTLWSALLTGGAGLLMHQSKLAAAETAAETGGRALLGGGAAAGLGAMAALAILLVPGHAGETEFPSEERKEADKPQVAWSPPSVLFPGGHVQPGPLTARVLNGQSESDADVKPGEDGSHRLADAVGTPRQLPGVYRIEALLPMPPRDLDRHVASSSPPSKPGAAATEASAGTQSAPSDAAKKEAPKSPIPPGTKPWHDPDVPGVDRVSVGTFEVPNTGLTGRFEDVSQELRTDGHDVWSWGDSRDPTKGYMLARWEAGTLHVLTYRPEPQPTPLFGPDRTAAKRRVDEHSLALSTIKRMDSEGLRVDKVSLSASTRNQEAGTYKSDPLGDGFKAGGLFRDQREFDIGFVRRERELKASAEPLELTRGRITPFGTHGMRTEQGILFPPLDPEGLKPRATYERDITQGVHVEVRFAVTADNEMRLAPPLDRSALNRASTPNHADLAGGPAYAAGILEHVKDGVLIEANNLSGHLAPYGDWAMAKTMAGAAQLGLDVSKAVYVEYYSVWGNAYPRRYFDMQDGLWHPGKPPEGRLPKKPDLDIW